jgi:hypothetical protein
MHKAHQSQVIEFTWIDRKARAAASAECRNVSIAFSANADAKKKEPGRSGLARDLLDGWRAGIDFG